MDGSYIPWFPWAFRQVKMVFLPPLSMIASKELSHVVDGTR
jgi:hypothetical protein